MKFVALGGVLLLVLAVAVAGTGDVAFAGGPTPTPATTAGPTSVPTPFPSLSTSIVVRFVKDEHVVTVLASGPSVYADGVVCLAPVPGAPRVLNSVTGLSWPLPPLPGRPVECTKGPPTTLRLEYGEDLSTEFVWMGQNMTVDIEVPPGICFWVLPTPAGLPGTGTAPGDGSPPDGLARALLGAVALAAAPLALYFYRRS